MNSSSETRLQFVAPQLAEKIRQLADMLEKQGITIAVVQGLRTVEQQDELYAQGRTAPGNIVTNAPGGHSWHNFGLAVDCAPLDGVVVDWDANHPSWKLMEEIGVSLGLTSGANWIRIKDAPHFQITGRFPEGAPNDEVRELLNSGGLQAVWDEVFGNVKTLSQQ